MEAAGVFVVFADLLVVFDCCVMGLTILLLFT